MPRSSAGRAHVVSVREAKAKLSSILDRVEHGAVVEISRRGRRIARVVALTDSGISKEDVQIELEKRGWILPGGSGGPPIPARAKRPVDLQKELRRQRSER